MLEGSKRAKIRIRGYGAERTMRLRTVDLQLEAHMRREDLQAGGVKSSLRPRHLCAIAPRALHRVGPLRLVPGITKIQNKS